MSRLDARALTRELVAFRTVNPPGMERACARHLGALLEGAGFRIEYHEFAEARTSLIASIGSGHSATPPICFTGHIDVVPLGAKPWSHDAFAGETDGDRIYGRGTTDMKSGIAAFVAAAIDAAADLARGPGLVVVITAGEEVGCEGAKYLADHRHLDRAGAIVVAEPTANYPYVGHKGLAWFEVETSGVTAHGSMPELGENAILKMARVIGDLERFEFAVRSHPVMGEPTLNVGTFEGGSGVNLVPDLAKIGVDIRTVPGVDHKKLISRLKTLMGKADVDVFSDLPPVWTAPDDDWMQRVFEICKPVLGKKPRARTATYMTDAANLLKVYAGAPTVVLGPGEAQMAHQTDEYCNMERIRESVAIYEALIDDWIR